MKDGFRESFASSDLRYFKLFKFDLKDNKWNKKTPTFAGVFAFTN